MTKSDQIAEIEARLAKITEGAWEYQHVSGRGHTVWAVQRRGSMMVAATGYADTFDRDNSEFIAHAPADIDFLLTALEESQAQILAERKNQHAHTVRLETKAEALSIKLTEARAEVERLEARILDYERSGRV